MKILFTSSCIGLLILLFSVSIGCKKFSDPGVILEPYRGDTTGKVIVSNADTTFKDRRVLLINIDGLSSSIFFDSTIINNYPFLKSLLANSKFGRAIDTTKMNNSLSWASMLTGNTITRVYDSSFYAAPVDSTNAIAVPLNITVIKYIQDYDSAGLRKIAVFSTWKPLVNTFLRYVNTKRVTSSDVETKDAILDLITNTRADLVIGSFDALKRNTLSYYVPDDIADQQQYQNVAKELDNQISQIYNAVNNRIQQTKENWLTIVTSTETSSDTSRTRKKYIMPFFIMHNKDFKSQNINKLSPSIQPKHEDIAANILYWLGVRKPSLTLNNGDEWLRRFSVEFIK